MNIDKSSIAHRLRVNCSFEFACNALRIPMNGNKMEEQFCSRSSNPNAHSVRSGKFNKLLTFKTEPSIATLKEMESKVTGVAALYNSPLWQALSCVENGCRDISHQLAQLDPIITQHLFELRRDEWGNLIRKELHVTEIKKIFMCGTTSSLATLILLRCEFDKTICAVSKYYLDCLIYESFINLCAHGILPCHHWPIFKNLMEWFARLSISPIQRVPKSESALNKLVSRRQLLASRFSNIKCRLSNEDSVLISHLYSLGNKSLIANELYQFVKAKPARVIQRKHKLGLLWVIGKLNAQTPRSDQIQIKVNSENHLRLIYPPVH